MANYNEGENFVKMDWAMPFQRTGKFPIDRSSIFSTKADADLYAKGGADSRGLGGTSYVGQIITVYENSKVEVYKIAENRTLEKVGNGLGTITADNYDAAKALAKADNIGQVIYCLNDQNFKEGETEKVEFSKGPYIVTAEGALLKLASSTASGDVVSDVAKLQERVNTLEGTVGKTAEDGLQKKVADNTTSISTNTSAITVINGEGEGSIKKSLTDAKEYTNQEVVKAVAHKVNGKAISTDPTLDGRDIALTDYKKGSKSALTPTDTVNAAFGKLEAGVEANASAIKTLNGTESEGASVSGKIKTAIDGLNVNDTAVEGQYISQVTETNGKITVTRADLPDAEGLANKALTDAKAYTDALANGRVAANEESITILTSQQRATANAVNAIDTKVDVAKVSTAISGAVDAEAKLARAAEKKNEDSIKAEEKARTEADAKHTQDIAANKSSIDTLTSQQRATANAVNAINTKVDVTKVSTAISEAVVKEKERAEAAELVHTNKIAGHETRIAANETAIKALSSATHFIGVFTRVGEGELPTDNIITDKYTEGHAPVDGDVVLDGNKEYIFSSKSWVELGDTTAEGNRILALENTVNGTGEGEKTGGLVQKVKALETSLAEGGATKEAIDAVTEGLASEIARAEKAEAMAKTVVEQGANIKVTASENIDGQPTTYTVAADGLALASDLSSANGKIDVLETFNTTNFSDGKANNALNADNASKAYDKTEEQLTSAILAGKAATAGTADTANALEKTYRTQILTDAAIAGNKAYAKKEVESYFGSGISTKNTVENAISTAKSGAVSDAKAETEKQITALNLGTASEHAHEDYATKTQGDLADSAIQGVEADGTYLTASDNTDTKHRKISANVATADDIKNSTANKLVDAVQAKAALDKKVDAVDGSRLMTNAEGAKLEKIAEGAQVNKIESVKVNGQTAAPSGDTKEVAIKVTATDTEIGTALNYGDSKPFYNADVKVNVVLQDIYTKLNAVNGAKIASIKAGNGVSVDNNDTQNPTITAVASKAEGNLVQVNSDGIYAAMYYDGDDAEGPVQK